MLSVRNLTLEEIQGFGFEKPDDVNWGVCVDGVPVAYFSAESDGTGRLNVHVNVKRRSIHPLLVKAYAKTFCDQLLTLGATGLLCRIEQSNRAAIRIARAAGFTETGHEGSLKIMEHHGR